MKLFILSSLVILSGFGIATASMSRNVADLGELCDSGSLGSCQELARITRGQCASPMAIGGCRYDSLTQF